MHVLNTSNCVSEPLTNPVVYTFNLCTPFTYSTGGVLLSSNVAASPTSLTILWTLAGDLTAISVYNISYFNTNTQCFIDSNDITGGATATWKVLTGLQEGTQYTITVTVLLSNGWYGANSTTVTTRDTG